MSCLQEWLASGTDLLLGYSPSTNAAQELWFTFRHVATQVIGITTSFQEREAIVRRFQRLRTLHGKPTSDAGKLFVLEPGQTSTHSIWMTKREFQRRGRRHH